MSIRSKMISLLALLFTVLIVIEVVVQREVLMPSFAALERDEAETQMRRVGFALDHALDALELNAADWGNWSDLYEFTQTPNQAFIDANITRVGLKQLKVNGILIVDMNGDRVLSSERSLDSGEVIRINFFDRPSLPADFPWRRNLAAATPARGLISTDAGIILAAAAPILDGSGAGRPHGMVIMGRLLSSTELRALGAQAQANLIGLPGRPASPDDEITETDDVTRATRPLLDVYGRPLMSFQVELPRRVTARGQDAVRYASLYLMGAAITVLALLVIALNVVVLQPLRRVTAHAVKVAEGKDLTARLGLSGKDEIAVLGREFDHMVDRLADAQRQLVDQSFQAGFAELAKGVLHNLGNAMTPLGVRLATLGERLKRTPAGDIALAVGELAKEDAGTQRHADLQEFLRLTLEELGSCFKESSADVEVAQRQAALVQTALAELMRSTVRNTPVIEAVRLPDLVAQTLEIVPDACRRRLTIDADESLRRIGVVQVARTVLRLILQNLIINAADAVRDAGKERGVLKVDAEIVSEADREQLHLRCRDDGIGISADNLPRVFEKGFSTKSRDTNYGIGLHWCANAIGALGGRIWAASAGPGRGASMHLMLPLPVRDARPSAS